MTQLRNIFYFAPHWVFRFLARRRWANLAALICRLTLRSPHGARRPNVGKPYTVFMLPRVIFAEDVVASFGDGDNFRIVMPSYMMIKGLADGFFPPYIDDNNYRSSNPEIEDCKRAYRKFLTRMWTKLRRYIQVDVVVTGNFAYFAERELATAVEDVGTPFIAMYKECLKVPGEVEFAKSLYRERRGPFTGRRVLVYNNIERELQIEAGIVEPEQITVCGMPRLDRVHRWRKANAGLIVVKTLRPQILFFSFSPTAALPRIPRRPNAGVPGNLEKLDPSFEDLSWKEMTRATYEAILCLARETPEVDVVIKSKVGRRDQDQLGQFLGAFGNLPSNVRVVVGGDPLDLIAASQVACGFNSTALMEAIAAGVSVVVPQFEEALEERMQPYIVDMEDAVYYARSPEQLVSRLREEALTMRPVPAELGEAQLRVLNRWVGNTDGRAGERVRTAVLGELPPLAAGHTSEAHG